MLHAENQPDVGEVPLQSVCARDRRRRGCLLEKKQEAQQDLWVWLFQRLVGERPFGVWHARQCNSWKAPERRKSDAGEAVTICEAAELVKERSKELQSTPTLPVVHGVETRGKQPNHSQPSQSGKEPTTVDAKLDKSDRNGEKHGCRRCATWHVSGKCSVYGQTGGLCKGMNHYAKNAVSVIDIGKAEEHMLSAKKVMMTERVFTSTQRQWTESSYNRMTGSTLYLSTGV